MARVQCRSGAGSFFIVIIAAEMAGLGYQVLKVPRNFLTERVFAGIFLDWDIGFVTDLGSWRLDRLVLPWFRRDSRLRSLADGRRFEFQSGSLGGNAGLR
jgi:ABC-type nitrate/sulfonate/bicarbonate transport system permease component